MPVDIAIILLGGILTVGSIVANHSTNTKDPVTRARDTLDRIRIILDCLKTDLRELSEESEQGQDCFDDHAEEYDVSEYADLKQAWEELVTDFKSYTEKIPDITSKQAATAQVIFRSHRKEIREFCNAVDALLSKTDRLNTDCSKSTTAFRKARERRNDNQKTRVLDLSLEYGPRPRSPADAKFPPGDFPLGIRKVVS